MLDFVFLVVVLLVGNVWLGVRFAIGSFFIAPVVVIGGGIIYYAFSNRSRFQLPIRGDYVLPYFGLLMGLWLFLCFFIAVVGMAIYSVLQRKKANKHRQNP